VSYVSHKIHSASTNGLASNIFFHGTFVLHPKWFVRFYKIGRKITRCYYKIINLATGYGMGDRGVGVRVQAGSNQSNAIQWVSWALLPWVKLSGSEADHSSLTSAEVKKNVDVDIHSPLRLHGLVLN
jgi:hypothetical protein